MVGEEIDVSGMAPCRGLHKPRTQRAVFISRLTNAPWLPLPFYFAAHCHVILSHIFPTVQITEVNEKERPTDTQKVYIIGPRYRRQQNRLGDERQRSRLGTYKLSNSSEQVTSRRLAGGQLIDTNENWYYWCFFLITGLHLFYFYFFVRGIFP